MEAQEVDSILAGIKGFQKGIARGIIGERLRIVALLREEAEKYIGDAGVVVSNMADLIEKGE